MRSFLLTLCLLLPAVAAAQDFGARFPAGSITTREQASQALEAAEKEHARVQMEFDARDAQCYREILVNDCRSKVRRDRELARREARRVELEAKDTQRRLDHEDLMRRRAEQEKQQAAEAEATPCKRREVAQRGGAAPAEGGRGVQGHADARGSRAQSGRLRAQAEGTRRAPRQGASRKRPSVRRTRPSTRRSRTKLPSAQK